MEDNFYEKLKDVEQMFREEEECFSEEIKKERFMQEYLERTEELEERYAQEMQYKADMLDNLGKGKSR